MLYPIGIQDFETLRTSGYVYVDKTALVYEMTRPIGRSYFLSRPRRFGKSLLISTLEAYFLGKRELFEGLAMERLEKDWTQYPVFHLDLNVGKYDTPSSFDEVLAYRLSYWESLYGSDPNEVTPALRFSGLLQRAYEKTGRKVAVLIDEYDKPLLNTIDNPELNAAYRAAMKAFYGVLKTQNAYIRFALLTGVSRFSHVSVFSDLNNLADISMNADYVDICGISETELHAYFDDSVRELAKANGMAFEEACEKLRRQYDGYHFCENSIGIYNPFSLISAFNDSKLDDYWFRTGTPTFLVKMLQQNDYDLRDMEGKMVSSAVLSSANTDKMSPSALLYQSGYLTIKAYDPETRLYALGFPNEEVERGFVTALVPCYTSMSDDDNEYFFVQMANDVKQGRPDMFMERIQTLLADNDYRVAGKMELYFQNTIGIIFKMLSFQVEQERATSRGRIDVTLQTRDYVYILELKLDKPAAEALQQIKDKQYAQPFLADSRKVFLIGASFSSETRTLAEWLVE